MPTPLQRCCLPLLLVATAAGSLAMFVQRKNAAGDLEWAVVDLDGGDGDSQGDDALAGLLQTSHYLDMFNDATRNEAYRRAIDAAVRPGDLVLDIGTGTGLLALLAARAATAGGAAGGVVACEVFPPMARAAGAAIAANGLADSISVVGKRSSDLSVGSTGDLPRRADVIVTEIFDSELLGEGVLPTMRHATQALLKEGGRVVPAGAVLWAQLVASPFLEQLAAQQPGTAGSAERFLQPLHLDALHPTELSPLSEPFRVFSFDFARPPPDERATELQVQASADGRLTAVVMWWELELDPTGRVRIGTAPAWAQGSQPGGGVGEQPLQRQQWRDHWKACWAPIGPVALGQGEQLALRWRHYAHDVSVALGAASTPGACAAPAQPPLQPGGSLMEPHAWADGLASLASGQGALWAVGLRLPDLYRAQQPLGAIEGFDFSGCNRLLGAAGAGDGWREAAAWQLWQCGTCSEATPRKLLCGGAASAARPAAEQTTVLRLSDAGAACHAVAFWVAAAEAEAVESQGRVCAPSQMEVGLLLLPEPCSAAVMVSVRLDAAGGGLQAQARCCA